MLPELTLESLLDEARAFSQSLGERRLKNLYGVTDGKAVGTFVEAEFRRWIGERYSAPVGNAALGCDFPSLAVDVKTTSERQPQSSCPFKSAREKVYGLPYSLLIFVYEKVDETRTKSACLNVKRCMFVSSDRSGDFLLTKLLREAVSSGAGEADVVAILQDRNLPRDEITLSQLASEVLHAPPPQGYLTISNALQWRLNYTRVLELQSPVEGIVSLR